MCRQLSHQSFSPLTLQPLLQLVPQCRVGAGKFEFIEHRGHIKPRSADQNGNSAASLEFDDLRASHGLVIRNASLPAYLPHIQQVVLNAASLTFSSLCGSDVHTPVELHCVCINNLRGETLSLKPLRKTHSTASFASPGRPHHRH